MERIKLNLIPSGVAPIVHLSQYDDGRQFGIDLFEGESVYVLDGTETLTVNSRKPDGHVVTLSVTNTGTSSVDVDTIEQLTAVHGVSYAKLKIEKGSVTIATLPFLIDVCRDPLKDGIESETEIHNLETQIHDMNEEMLPDMVAEEVARQYTGDVIFDDEPTENHGDGYAVNSAGLKAYIPKAIDELDDVEINNPQANQAIVYDPVSDKFKNGEVSTVGGLNDLNDVTIDDTSLEQGQELVYNGTEEVFENKTTRVELTQAEYNALANPLPDVDYYITDAPSMQGTSADLSYDGDTESVYDVVEGVKADVADLDTSKVDISDLTPKQFTTSSLISIQGNETVTQTFTVTNAKYGIITGFAITSNLNVVALQFFFNTPTTVQVRVQNVSATADVFGIIFFYI